MYVAQTSFGNPALEPEGAALDRLPSKGVAIADITKE